jgi:hypothetical protein
MAEAELKSLIDKLTTATKSAEDVTKANQRLVDYLNKNPGDACAVNWEGPLMALRAARAFSPMAKLAECLIGFGCERGVVRRQYGQALIELGQPSAAIDVLRPLAESNDAERLEAKGLIGRAFKEIYVGGRLGNTEIGKRTLQRALNAYGEAYKSNKPIWHGINIAALLHRARIDGLDVSAERTSEEMASEILDSIDEKERKGTLGLGDQSRGPYRQQELGRSRSGNREICRGYSWGLLPALVNAAATREGLEYRFPGLGERAGDRECAPRRARAPRQWSNPSHRVRIAPSGRS